MCAPLLKEKSQAKNISSDKVKGMMVYIHEHYAEKISIRELASAVFLSERECYRVFQNHLHMTPADYIRSYRIQIACQMLAESQVPVTEVGRLRYGKFQLFRKGIPGGDRLYAASIPPQMAG